MKERNKPTKSFIARSIEEIEKEAFKKGYEAGKQEMIDKAWDWFYNMALDYMSGDITDVKWGSMKEDFIKAMED